MLRKTSIRIMRANFKSKVAAWEAKGYRVNHIWKDGDRYCIVQFVDKDLPEGVK